MPPRKEKKTAPAGWTCGCGVKQPHYIVWCHRCQKGKS